MGTDLTLTMSNWQLWVITPVVVVIPPARSQLAGNLAFAPLLVVAISRLRAQVRFATRFTGQTPADRPIAGT